jgi:hypothetical protein
MKITADKQIGQLRAAAAAAIEKQADAEAAAVTPMGAARTLTYLLKLDAARAVAAGAPAAVMLEADIGVTGADMKSVAAALLERHDRALATLAAIDKARMRAVAAVAAADTVEAVQAATKVVWPAP